MASIEERLTEVEGRIEQVSALLVETFQPKIHGLMQFAGGQVRVENAEGIALQGVSRDDLGVHGISENSSGLQGRHGTNSDIGEAGFVSGPRMAGVWGDSRRVPGVLGTSDDEAGVTGISSAASGMKGMADAVGTEKTMRAGVWGDSVSHVGVAGTSALAVGVTGKSESAPGVEGTSASAPGVSGASDKAPGVLGRNPGTTGPAGVKGLMGAETGHARSAAVWGDSQGFTGVLGTSQFNDGVNGVSDSGAGVRAESKSGTAVDATSESGLGLFVRGSICLTNSGVVIVPQGSATASVDVAGLHPNTLVVATVQVDQRVFVRSVLVGPGRISILLDGPASTNVRVAWLAFVDPSSLLEVKP